MAGVQNKTMKTVRGIGNIEKDQYQVEQLSI